MRKLLRKTVLALALGVATPLAVAAAQPKAVVQTYSDIALAGYQDALASAQALRTAIDALIAAPSAQTLQA
ncbi:peptidase, partial [Bordetella pertussis]